MTKERLRKEFTSFDSIDPRMERVPLDLRKEEFRNKYIENHKVWFLNNHEASIKKFMKQVELAYPKDKNRNASQIKMFDYENITE